MRSIGNCAFFLFFLIFLWGCGSGYGIYHRVGEGESFDMVCRAYGVNGKEVAKLNNISDTSKVRAGDAIWIPGASRQLDVRAVSSSSGGNVAVKPRKTAEKSVRRRTKEQYARSSKKVHFSWPVKGDVVSRFGDNNGEIHDGIDISAAAGTEVKAAAPGRVIYSGDEIKGYGNLIIIKHEGAFSTVYAHNQRNMVRKGDFIKSGQVIALVGNSGRGSGPNLHFEIRRGKEAVDPLKYLPER